MVIPNISTLLIATLLITGCGGSNNGGLLNPPKNSGPLDPPDSNTANISITCVDVSAESRECANQIDAGEETVNIGTFTRGTTIAVAMSGVNTASTDWDGYYHFVFDKGCSGDDDWEIIPQRAITFLANGGWSAGAFSDCAEMPLGSRSVRAKLLDANLKEVNLVVIQFTLE